VKDKL